MLRSCLIAFALLYSPAIYADETKTWTTVDMTIVLTDENHRPIKDQLDGATPGDLTLGHAVAHALFFVSGDEKDVTPEQKWAWAVLADKIKDDPHAVLTNAEGALIYKRLGKLYNGVVLMRAMPLLDPNRKPPSID